MSKKNDKISLWEHYLTKEIGIEFKACLYFYAILFYYCVYQLCTGSFQAEILHMGEMILLTYLMGYVQVFLLWNFDEADELGGKEILGIILCTIGYTLASYFLGWFRKSIPVTGGFAAYVVFSYLCAFFVYKSKRRIDDKILNNDLKLFQTRHPDKKDSSED